MFTQWLQLSFSFPLASKFFSKSQRGHLKKTPCDLNYCKREITDFERMSGRGICDFNFCPSLYKNDIYSKGGNFGYVLFEEHLLCFVHSTATIRTWKSKRRSSLLTKTNTPLILMTLNPIKSLLKYNPLGANRNISSNLDAFHFQGH